MSSNANCHFSQARSKSCRFFFFCKVKTTLMTYFPLQTAITYAHWKHAHTHTKKQKKKPHVNECNVATQIYQKTRIRIRPYVFVLHMHKYYRTCGKTVILTHSAKTQSQQQTVAVITVVLLWPILPATWPKVPKA